MEILTRSDGTTEITGYVNATERPSRVLHDSQGYFVETIAKGAFARALERSADQKMLLDHKTDRVLAQGEDLMLTEDNVGLYVRAIVRDVDVASKATQDQLRGWSFGFRPISQDVAKVNGMAQRRVNDLDLIEVSLIDQDMMPAYEATSVYTRAEDETEVCYRSSLDVITRTEEEAPAEPEPEVTEETPPDLSYYTDIMDELRKKVLENG